MSASKAILEECEVPAVQESDLDRLERQIFECEREIPKLRALLTKLVRAEQPTDAVLRLLARVHLTLARERARAAKLRQAL